jgi:hypothetical protein
MSKQPEPKGIGYFPTDIFKLKEGELKALVFSKDGMAARIIEAFERFGAARGSRGDLTKFVKQHFPKASDATVKTQTYRGLVYLKSIGKLKEEKKA